MEVAAKATLNPSVGNRKVFAARLNLGKRKFAPIGYICLAPGSIFFYFNVHHVLQKSADL